MIHALDYLAPWAHSMDYSFQFIKIPDTSLLNKSYWYPLFVPTNIKEYLQSYLCVVNYCIFCVSISSANFFSSCFSWLNILPLSVSDDSKVTFPNLSLFVQPILNDPTFQTLQITYVFQSQSILKIISIWTMSRSPEIMEKFISLRIPVQRIES